MKPSNAKLVTLHRETLARLDVRGLGAVAGGSVNNPTVVCSNKPPTAAVVGTILVPAACH